MSFIYALEMQIPGYPFNPIKIGFSTNPDKRLQSYTVGPFPTKVLAVWPGTKEDEAELHKQFKESRLNGEWFIPTQGLINIVDYHEFEEAMLEGAQEAVEENMREGESELECRERLFGDEAMLRYAKEAGVTIELYGPQ